MKRERNKDSDSFDMLLDAMCNTFGGIVFIALLIALLSNSTSSVTNGPEKGPIRRPETVIKWLESSENCKDLVALIGKTATTISDVISEKEGLEKKLVGIGADITAGNATIEELEKEIQSIKSSHKKIKNLHMPILREIKKEPAVMAVHNGKFFPVHNINQTYDINQKREFDLSDVSITMMGLGYEVRLLPQKGQPVTDDALQKGGKIEKALSNINPEKEFILIAVSKNSFTEFIKIKEIILQKKIKYNWHCSVIINNVFPIGVGKSEGM